ncbi:Calcineurin-like_phosphoesterase [Hexamita inflata]|uniref:Calcineurin-like_phosphoesterase n=1 Tax=Hexamita inflata TaxID=28002 RepID=A0ABP1HDL2_9EUKA
MINISIISDTHGKHDQITKYLPGGDILFCAGDVCTSKRSNMGINDFLDWATSLNYQHVILIGGNHDYPLEKDIYARQLLSRYKNVIYLNDEQVTVNVNNIELKIFGSPHSPPAGNDAFFMSDLVQIKHRFRNFDHPDVVLTHSPPYRVLDKNCLNSHMGCRILRQLVDEQKPKLHIFGHTHEAAGAADSEFTHFFNAAVVNGQFVVANKPRTFKWNVLTNEIVQ